MKIWCVLTVVVFLIIGMLITPTTTKVGTDRSVPYAVIIANTFHKDVVLSARIGADSEYDQLVKVLREAPSFATITIYLSGLGGDVTGAVAITNAVSASKAHIRIVATGPTESAHALLLLQDTEKLELPSAGYLMLHDTQLLFPQGPVAVTKVLACTADESLGAYAAAQIGVRDSLMDGAAFSVLTEDELLTIHRGGEVYIQYSDLKKRLAVLSQVPMDQREIQLREKKKILSHNPYTIEQCAEYKDPYEQ